MTGRSDSATVAARALAGAVRGYQLVVSPWLPQTCRYYPSCSGYAVTALRRHGAVRGVLLGAWRLLRCNPWSDGGVDHVPPADGNMPWSRAQRGARTLQSASCGTQPSAASSDLEETIR